MIRSKPKPIFLGYHTQSPTYGVGEGAKVAPIYIFIYDLKNILNIKKTIL